MQWIELNYEIWNFYNYGKLKAQKTSLAFVPVGMEYL